MILETSSKTRLQTNCDICCGNFVFSFLFFVLYVNVLTNSACFCFSSLHIRLIYIRVILSCSFSVSLSSVSYVHVTFGSLFFQHLVSHLVFRLFVFSS